MQQGRFFVALGLAEAEHLRGAMHLMAGQSWLQDCCLALRCIQCKESVNESLLDFVGPVRESSKLGFQLQAAEQLLRFLDSAEDFQAREVSVLLRSLQLTRTQDRLPWWLDVRACRRRAHRHWQRLAVSKIFLQTDEFEDWATKALLLRLRWTLAAQRLWPSDAFRFMDTANNGCLQRRDLSAGLESLGVRSEGLHDARWTQQVANLFRWIAQEGREVLFLEDFRAALELHDTTLEGHQSFSAAASPASRASPASLRGSHGSPGSEAKETACTKPPRQADAATPPAPMSESGKSAAGEEDAARPGAPKKTVEERDYPASPAAASPLTRPRTPSCSPEGSVSRLSPDMCRQLSAGRFKHKWQKHSAFHPVWFANDMGAKPSLAIWAAVELVPRGKFLGVKRGSHAVKERLAFGHYVSMSPSPPVTEVLEITDEQYSGFFAKHPRDELNRFLDTYFPHPIRFRQVWHLRESALKSVYMWAPVPPSPDFTACGMLCTTDDEAPALQEVRCLPRRWPAWAVLSFVPLSQLHSLRGASESSTLRRAMASDEVLPEADSLDWRQFRARLIERETSEVLLDDSDASAVEHQDTWMHRSPLVEKGSVLVAKPGFWSLDCPCFHKAVILITEHGEDYDMGFVLNRPTTRVETFGRLEFTVWYGGPCQSLDHDESDQWKFCLHMRPDIPGAEPIAQGIYMSEPWAAAGYILESDGKASEEDFMLLVGHCGWGPGQLEAELAEGDTWLLAAADTKALLSSRTQKALRRKPFVLGRGLPLWRRLYRRLVLQQEVQEGRIIERYGDEALLRFVQDELDAAPQPPTTRRRKEKSDFFRDFLGRGPDAEDANTKSIAKQVLSLMASARAPEVAENGCEALRNLVVDEETRSLVSGLGAIDMVMDVMQSHSDSSGVQGHCAGTLTHLAAGSAERQAIFHRRGPELVVKAMRKHRDVPLVQWKGCAVLANLAASTVEQIRVATAGAAGAVVQGMANHEDERLVQDYCIGALYNLARVNANMNELARAGSAKVVRTALLKHPDAPTVQKVGAELAQSLEHDS
ncbi:aarA [Symbiodinium sp. CCMP2592]|nr:aarA [Symbiodinium sp. CCMP2592]